MGKRDNGKHSEPGIRYSQLPLQGLSRLCRLSYQALKLTPSAIAIPPSEPVRRRCTTNANRGCRRSRNPRIVPSIHAPLNSADTSSTSLRRNGTAMSDGTESFVPQRRRQVGDTSTSFNGAWCAGAVRGLRLRLHPRLSHVVHLRCTPRRGCYAIANSE